MTILFRLILSAILALISTLLLQLANSGGIFPIDPMTLAILFVACTSAALISPALCQQQKSSSTNSKRSASSNSSSSSSSSEDREQGLVKWFNVSKGYGFVTRQSGEDIFVHFRSIRGEGRRILREGQTVEFVVIDGDKGPQAEDVEAL